MTRQHLALCALLLTISCNWSIDGAPCASVEPMCSKGYVCCSGACVRECAKPAESTQVQDSGTSEDPGVRGREEPQASTPKEQSAPEVITEQAGLTPGPSEDAAASSLPTTTGSSNDGAPRAASTDLADAASLSDLLSSDAGPLSDGGIAPSSIPNPDSAEPAQRAGCVNVAQERCSAPQLLSAGAQFTCARLPRGAVECWGDYWWGQLGQLPPLGEGLPNPIPVLPNTVEVTAGAHHACALTSAGDVQCWGRDERGQLGFAERPFTLLGVPGLVSGLPSATTITAGGAHSCAVGGDGHAYCWGANDHGQLGDGTRASRFLPAPVALDGVRHLSAGFEHTCAVTVDGDVHCWGDSSHGQLGDGTPGEDALVPQRVALDRAALRVASAGRHTCALLDDGSVQCWGDNEWGQLGDGTTESRPRPAPTLPLAGPVVDLAAGGGGLDPATGHTCAVAASGTVSCWGANRYGQLGSFPEPDLLARAVPNVIPALVARRIAVGDEHTCILRLDDGISCWGADFEGELGHPFAQSFESTPVSVYGVPELDPSLEPCADPYYRRPALCPCSASCSPLESCGYEGAEPVCQPAFPPFEFRWPCRQRTPDGKSCIEDAHLDTCDEMSRGVTLGGDPSVLYDVMIGVTGVVQPSRCVGGEAHAGYTLGGHPTDSDHQKYYGIDYEGPGAETLTAWLNCAPDAAPETPPVALDYTITVPVRGGKSLSVFIIGECAGHLPNCVDPSAAACEPLGTPLLRLAPEEQALQVRFISAEPQTAWPGASPLGTAAPVAASMSAPATQE